MNYIAEVAELFRSRCGGTRIFGPMDYVIVAEWEKQGIPLFLVLTVINDVWDHLNDAEKAVESVSYFQEAIKRSFRFWLQTGTGVA